MLQGRKTRRTKFKSARLTDSTDSTHSSPRHSHHTYHSTLSLLFRLSLTRLLTNKRLRHVLLSRSSLMLSSLPFSLLSISLPYLWEK